MDKILNMILQKTEDVKKPFIDKVGDISRLLWL